MNHDQSIHEPEPSVAQRAIQKKFRTGDVIIISLTHLLHDIYSSFLAPILPLIIEKLGISMSMAGVLSVIQRIPSLFNPFVGILAENMRIRYLVIFAPAITTISMSLIGWAPSYAILVILLFTAGISSTMFHVPSPVMIQQISGVHIGRGMSFFMVGGELARTLGPLIIVAAVTQWGLEGTYRLIPFGLAASATLFLRLRKMNIREEIKKMPRKGHYLNVFKTFSPVFMVLGLILLFRGGMKAALTLYLSVYLTDQGHSLWYAGAALSAVQLAGVLGTSLAGTISDKIGRRTTMVIITGASPLLMFLFLTGPDILMLPALISTGFFLISTGPVMLAVIHELESRHLPFLNGIFMTLNFGVSSLMLMVVGILSDAIGLHITYQIANLLALLAIPVAFFIPRKK
jgi:FSR family fosmidomycin resistance protein-like MFS transporter